MKLSLALATAALATAVYAAPAHSGDQLNCTTGSTHALKWMKGWGKDKPHGFFTFDAEKDEQGRPVATALNKDGSAAKPVKFHFQSCAAPKGKPGYMGYGTGEHANGAREGHFQLVSDPSKCLTVTSTKGQHIRLVLDKCQYSDSKVQETQFFGLGVNAISSGIRPRADDMENNNYKYRMSNKGAQPMIIANTGKDVQDEQEAYLYWEPFDN